MTFGAYFSKFRINNKLALIESVSAVIASALWMLMKPQFQNIEILSEIEPMIIGIVVALSIHLVGVARYNKAREEG